MKTTRDITDAQIEEARQVLEDHVVNPLGKEGALENLLWCIASQGLGWEPASNFVYNLRDESRPEDKNAKMKFASLEVLFDKDRVYGVSKRIGLRFAYARRFDSAIDYFTNRDGEWWNDVLQAGVKDRENYVRDIKWVSNKTFSFWHLCLGGKNLIALDVHVMRGLNELGVEMNKGYYNPIRRKTGSQKVRRTPSEKDYLRIEEEAREIFSSDERFLKSEGEVDMSLIDAVLWWKGANRGSNGQAQLFGNALSWMMPYAHKEAA